MRVLVTGASGFVGARLLRALVERGDAVWGTYLGRPPEVAGGTLVEADLRAPAKLAEVVASARPEVVLHLAGLSHVGESWNAMAAYFQVNVLGTEALLRAAPGARLVLASSAEVYGLVPEEDQPIGEERPLAPQSPYALTKAAAERLVLAAGGLVVRSFNIVGPGQAANFALPAFAEQLAAIRRGERRGVLEVGNLAARRDFVHLADAVDAYLAVAERGVAGGVYNLGSGTAHSIGDMLERLVAVSGVEARIEIDSQRFRPVDLPLLQADAGRLRGLGWAPERDLETALDELWRQTLSAAG